MGSSAQRKKRASKAPRKRTSPRIWVGIIAVVLIGYLIFSGGNSSSTPEPIGGPFEVRSNDRVKGAEGGNIILIEYLDFECASCKAYYPLIKELVEEYPNELRVVTRYLPLSGHPNATTAARAAEAAGKQGKFWVMHDLLFEKQDEWSNKNSADQDMFIPYAKEVGLDLEVYAADVDSKAVKDRVTLSAGEARQLGVTSTPTFFLNGQRLQNPRTIEDFKTLIEAEILKNPLNPRGAKVHEHADFKLFINNKEFNFGEDGFQSTTGKELNQALHLHDNNGNNIHKHYTTETMGDFFTSLGMTLTDECLILDTKEEFCNEGINSFKFYVNGELVPSLADYEFKDLDRILISYGAETDEEIQVQLDSVTDLACMYSGLCPERGTPPTENCVVGLGGDCD